MANKIKEAISHNYDPVNQYIDDQARLKRSASSWQSAKSISLILVSLGQKINEVDRKFEQSESLDKTQEKLINGEIIKYNSETLRFLLATNNDYSIMTRITYSTTKDLLEGNQPKKIDCYIQKNGVSFEFDLPEETQLKNLPLMGIDINQAKSYKRYCQYDIN